MLPWVSLVHVGQWLPAQLSQYFQRALGISLAEQDLMKQLDVAGGGLRMVDLAERIFLSKAGVTKMVDRLETAGMARRERSVEDRRVIHVRLTVKGKRTLKRSRELLLPWVEAHLADKLTGRELKALGGALESLLRGHDRWDSQAAHLKPSST